MSESKPKRTFILSQPIVGAHDYVCRDPSGWPVSYNRAEADEMLSELLEDFPIDLAIEGYLASAPVRQVGMTIETLQAHLVLAGKLDGPDRIPLPALVSFWARAAEMKKALAKVNKN